MTFKEAIEKDDKCPKCGSTVIFIYGDMWDYDRQFCSNRDCDYEIEYDTSTIVSNTQYNSKQISYFVVAI